MDTDNKNSNGVEAFKKKWGLHESDAPTSESADNEEPPTWPLVALLPAPLLYIVGVALFVWITVNIIKIQRSGERRIVKVLAWLVWGICIYGAPFVYKIIACIVLHRFASRVTPRHSNAVSNGKSMNLSTNKNKNKNKNTNKNKNKPPKLKL